MFNTSGPICFTASTASTASAASTASTASTALVPDYIRGLRAALSLARPHRGHGQRDRDRDRETQRDSLHNTDRQGDTKGPIRARSEPDQSQIRTRSEAIKLINSLICLKRALIY